MAQWRAGVQLYGTRARAMHERRNVLTEQDGLFLEIGPFRMQDKDTLVENPGSWHEYANLLFIDNPLGTGFSFVDSNQYVKEMDEMAEQLVNFMDKFVEIFPEYANDDVSGTKRHEH